MKRISSLNPHHPHSMRFSASVMAAQGTGLQRVFEACNGEVKPRVPSHHGSTMLCNRLKCNASEAERGLVVAKMVGVGRRGVPLCTATGTHVQICATQNKKSIMCHQIKLRNSRSPSSFQMIQSFLLQPNRRLYLKLSTNCRIVSRQRKSCHR